MPHFEAASKCQEQIKNSSNMAKESFAQKCSIVLEELRAETVVKIRQVQSVEGHGWGQIREETHPDSGIEDEAREDPSTKERPQVQMGETSYFSGEWNDMSFVSRVNPPQLQFLLSFELLFFVSS